MAPQKLKRSAKAIQHDNDASDSDDAPESIPLSQSKRAVQDQESVLKQAEAAAKKRKREENKERDRKLKERAEVNKSKKKKAVDEPQDKGKGKAVVNGKYDEDEDDEMDGGDTELEARMRRAMAEAAEEDSEDEEEGFFDGMQGGDSEDDEEFGGIGSDDDDDDDDDMGSDDAEDDSEAGSADDDEEQVEVAPLAKRRRTQTITSDATSSKQNSRVALDHLPDELFTAAFQQKSTPIPAVIPISKKFGSEGAQEKRRRRKQSSSKDLILGSRKIRVLASNANDKPVLPPTVVPSKKVRKFLDRSLALKKGGGASARTGKPQLGWERRPANIGVLRGSGGPAAHFVRQV